MDLNVFLHSKTQIFLRSRPQRSRITKFVSVLRCEKVLFTRASDTFSNLKYAPLDFTNACVKTNWIYQPLLLTAKISFKSSQKHSRNNRSLRSNQAFVDVLFLSRTGIETQHFEFDKAQIFNNRPKSSAGDLFFFVHLEHKCLIPRNSERF